MRENQEFATQAISDAGQDALVIFGPDNFTYLTGMVLPFPFNHLDRKAIAVIGAEGGRHVICPCDWRQALQDQGWDGGIETYSEHAGPQPGPMLDVLARRLRLLGMESGRLAFDHQRLAQGTLVNLKDRLPAAEWTFGDSILRDLRIRKREREINLLEGAARQADLGIIGALNHMEGSLGAGGYTISEFSERVRVHAFEAGSTGVGHVAALSGEKGTDYFAPQRYDKFAAGDMVRVDITCHLQGYWANIGRMVVMGKPTLAQVTAYRQNLALKAVARDLLVPGNRCDHVFAAVLSAAKRSGSTLWEEVGVGHGVGVSEREAPYLQPGDPTALESGMVITLDVNTLGPCGEIIHSKDTFELQPEGARLMSWYRNWDRLYHVMGFRSAH